MMSKAIKKALSILLCAALLFGAVPLNGFVGLNLPSLSSLFASIAHAADPTSGTCGDNLTWVYDEAAATLTISGTGAMSSYTNNSNTVTSAPWWLYYNTMKTLVVESGVTSIGSEAFYGCTGLTSVTIPDSVTSIGNHAFRGCTGLTSITIPNSVMGIGSGAFGGCSSLVTVFYNAEKATGTIASPFAGVSSLNTVIVGEGVESLPANLFRGAENVETVILPRSVKTISKRF